MEIIKEYYVEKPKGNYYKDYEYIKDSCENIDEIIENINLYFKFYGINNNQ